MADVVSAGSAQDKAALRQLLLQRRGSLTDGAAASQRACSRLTDLMVQKYGSARAQIVLSGYMPMRGELDPLPAMAAHPGPVGVPVVIGREQALDFHRWHAGCLMVPGSFKALVPAEPDPVVPQVLIVPLLGFDPGGFRLGYGGGFYDRTLEALRASGPVLAIGFAHEGQEVAEVPREVTDQRLDLIVTPDRVICPE